MSLKQRKIKFEPRIKLNHNIYISKVKTPEPFLPVKSTDLINISSVIFHVFFNFEILVGLMIPSLEACSVLVS